MGSALVACAVAHSAEEVSLDLKAYEAPAVIIEGKSSGTTVSKHVALKDSASAGAFTAWGSVSGTDGTCSIKVLEGKDGQNYLNLKSVKGSVGYNLMAQAGTTGAKSLSDSWSVKTRFSATAGDGSLYLGLYAAKKMSSVGGFDYKQLVVGYTNIAATALGLSVSQSGKIVAVRTAENNMLEFWNGSEWVRRGQDAFAASGFDIRGKTQYDLTLSCDGTVLRMTLAKSSDSEPVFTVESPVSTLGSNIGGQVRFSAGDIANNSTDGWDFNIYSLSLQ